MLGLAKKAGKLSLGYDAVMGSVLSRKSKLIAVTNDASEKNYKKIKKYSLDYGVDILKIGISMNELGVIFGKKIGFVSINDRGFAKKIIELGDLDYDG